MRYNSGNANIVKDIQIDVKGLLDELKEIHKTVNTLCNHYSIDPKKLNVVADNHKKDLIRDCDRHDSYGDSIQYLKKRHTSNTGANYGDTRYIRELLNTEKSSVHTMQNSIAEFISLNIRRMAAIKLLTEKYANITEKDILDSTASKEAQRWFNRNVATNIGWRNSIHFVPGAEGTIVDYTEEVNGIQTGSVNWDMQIGIEGTWLSEVVANGIQLVDIGGKSCMTLCAKEIEEHELKDDDVRLFQAKVVYTHVPRTMDTWCPKPGDGKDVVKIEDKVIAIQTYESGERPTITTGKNQSWAIRTMRGRMKKKMMQMMDLI